MPCLALFAGGCLTQNSELDETERDEDGQVVEGGDVGVFKLRVGDCLDIPFDDPATEPGATVASDEVESFDAVPCDQPHTGEVILVDEQFYADLDEFPGENAAFESATPACITAIDDYTGTSYEQSQFDIYSLVPTEDSWDIMDDRTLVCIGYTLDESLTTVVETTGSMRAPG
jgi:hypothetical protein